MLKLRIGVNRVEKYEDNIRKDIKSEGRDFKVLKDVISEEIKRNVKDPIDRDEDLRFWNDISKGFKLNNNTYEEFLKLKKSIIGFPPPSASGRVRKEYREYMDKLPVDVRDKVQGILTFTYAEVVKDKSINTEEWGRILKAMEKKLGKIGDLNIDFDFIRKCLKDFEMFDNVAERVLILNDR